MLLGDARCVLVCARYDALVYGFYDPSHDDDSYYSSHHERVAPPLERVAPPHEHVFSIHSPSFSSFEDY